SQDEYHRSLDLHYARLRGRRAGRGDFDGESEIDPGLHNWDPHLSPVPDGFPGATSFALPPEEAAYLPEQILNHCGESLLAWLVRERVSVEHLPFAWDFDGELPERLRGQLDHGRNFSEVMHGAQLLYNLMLAEQRQWADSAGEYRALMAEWWERIEANRPAL